MAKHSASCLALVTGSTSGVGEAVARALLERRWRVIGIGRRRATIAHDAYEHVQLDLADVAALAPAMHRDVRPALTSQPWRRVALINNAADPGYLGWLTELGAVEHARVQAVNVVAPTWLMGFFVRETPPGAALRIVNVSSGAARRAIPGLGAYSASKAALRMAGMIVGTELEAARGSARERRDVAVLTYMPGVVETPMQRLARSRPIDEFPSRRMFEEFVARGVVVPPEAPAREIADFAESDGRPSYAEAQLGDG